MRHRGQRPRCAAWGSAPAAAPQLARRQHKLPLVPRFENALLQPHRSPQNDCVCVAQAVGCARFENVRSRSRPAGPVAGLGSGNPVSPARGTTKKSKRTASSSAADPWDAHPPGGCASCASGRAPSSGRDLDSMRTGFRRRPRLVAEACPAHAIIDDDGRSFASDGGEGVGAALRKGGRRNEIVLELRRVHARDAHNHRACDHRFRPCSPRAGKDGMDSPFGLRAQLLAVRVAERLDGLQQRGLVRRPLPQSLARGPPTGRTAPLRLPGPQNAKRFHRRPLTSRRTGAEPEPTRPHRLRYLTATR